MRSPLPFPCVPDRPYMILLVQVGTLSFSHPSFGVPVLFIYLFYFYTLGTGLARTGTNTGTPRIWHLQTYKCTPDTKHDWRALVLTLTKESSAQQQALQQRAC